MRRASVVTERVALVGPSAADEREFLARVAESAVLHRGWVSAPSTPDTYASYVQRVRRPEHAGFLVRARHDEALVGVVNVNHIILGALRCGHLGYYAFTAGAGCGYMTEAVAAVVDHAFARLGLHRLEANIQPSNARSLALAARCGFRREGFSPRYLYLDGAWRDHERWAVTVEDRRVGAHAGTAG